MFRKNAVSILLLIAIVCTLSYAQNQVEKAKPVKKSILIVRDSSDLEKGVSRIIIDSLAKKGYKIKETGIADIGKKKASSYNVSIVFSAVNPGEEIDPRIQKYISTKAKSSSKVHIFTVYGAVYEKKDEKEQQKNVDAASEATKAIHPQMIADHILQSLKL